MGFTKRRKRPELFRGDNHDATEEAQANPPPSRVAHSNPDPTHEQRGIAVMPPGRTIKRKGRK